MAVCAAHGGRAPQVKAKAARVIAERRAEKLLVGVGDYQPVTDALGELQRLAGRALRWLDVLEGSSRTSSGSGTPPRPSRSTGA